MEQARSVFELELSVLSFELFDSALESSLIAVNGLHGRVVRDVMVHHFLDSDSIIELQASADRLHLRSGVGHGLLLAPFLLISIDRGVVVRQVQAGLRVAGRLQGRDVVVSLGVVFGFVCFIRLVQVYLRARSRSPGCFHVAVVAAAPVSRLVGSV